MSNPIPRLRRILTLIPLIQRRGGIAFSELQRILGVSKRELNADLNAIMLCGVPPYLPNDYISVFIDEDWVSVDYAGHFNRPARLTLQEALALRLAIARLPVPEDGPLYEAYIELLEAIDALVLKEDMASLEGRIEAPRSLDTDQKLAILDEAIARRLPISITYYSPSSERVTRRQLRPYGRGDKLGNQYLVAWCEVHDDVRSFRIDRMSEIALVEDEAPFEPPEKFDLDRFVSDIGPKPSEAFHLRVRFDQAITRFVADDFSEMRVDRAEDGDIVVEMTCGSIPWAVSKVLLYGELAEILEPAQGREEMVGRLKAFLAS